MERKWFVVQNGKQVDIHWKSTTREYTIASDLSSENAAYIVRAVNCHDELVEALKRARDHMIMSEGVFISDGKIGQSADWAEALQQVRAAVDKAEGKQP
jgi:hypothetical protein